MADIRVELHKKNANNGFDRLIVETDIHSVDGLLNNQGKIDANLIPDSLMGALRFQGTVDKPTPDGEGGRIIDAFIGSSTEKGHYFIATTDVTIYCDSSSPYQIVKTSGVTIDDGATLPTTSLPLEKGDWLVVNNIDHTATPKTVEFAIINNAYPDATKYNKGVVKLANDIITSDYGVITGNLLFEKMPSLITTHHPTSGVTIGSGNYFTVNAEGHITDKEMRNASETDSGFIEIATTAEMKVDTNDALAMTPKKTKQAIDWWGGLRYYAAEPPVADIAEGCIVAVLKS